MDISSDTIVQNRYRLQHRLGRGSFGEVWSAHDEVADVDVALKIYVALDDKGIEEFILISSVRSITMCVTAVHFW